LICLPLSKATLFSPCPITGQLCSKEQYCRPAGALFQEEKEIQPKGIVPGKYLAGGLQSCRTANLTDAQYKLTYELTYPFSKRRIFTEKPVKCY
jgi:hypothetical protein